MDLTKINEYFEGEYVEKRMTAYEMAEFLTQDMPESLKGCSPYILYHMMYIEKYRLRKQIMKSSLCDLHKFNMKEIDFRSLYPDCFMIAPSIPSLIKDIRLLYGDIIITNIPKSLLPCYNAVKATSNKARWRTREKYISRKGIYRMLKNQKLKRVDIERIVNKTIGLVKSMKQEIKRLLQLSEEGKLS